MTLFKPLTYFRVHLIQWRPQSFWSNHFDGNFRLFPYTFCNVFGLETDAWLLGALPYFQLVILYTVNRQMCINSHGIQVNCMRPRDKELQSVRSVFNSYYADFLSIVPLRFLMTSFNSLTSLTKTLMSSSRSIMLSFSLFIISRVWSSPCSCEEGVCFLLVSCAHLHNLYCSSHWLSEADDDNDDLR